eukprot:31114-Pelagococcus_subviridis.AAC.8
MTASVTVVSRRFHRAGAIHVPGGGGGRLREPRAAERDEILLVHPAVEAVEAVVAIVLVVVVVVVVDAEVVFVVFVVFIVVGVGVMDGQDVGARVRASDVVAAARARAPRDAPGDGPLGVVRGFARGASVARVVAADFARGLD